jgi:hypothetical protein
MPLAATQSDGFSSETTGPIMHFPAEEIEVNPICELALVSDGTNGSTDAPSPSMPLIFAPIDLAGLNLDEGQDEGLDELRQQFIAEVGGLDQDPSDATYAARWQQAQPRIDALVPGLIGREIFLRMQMQSAPDSAE